jgi:hypothetical protein
MSPDVKAAALYALLTLTTAAIVWLRRRIHG